ncbi:hypothetical protein HK096_007166 [Nowakowskiella sp. JEL0078]|nr:hypothetical protein HK096_007166 [Nowakowskiella sp. JEL0078]
MVEIVKMQTGENASTIGSDVPEISHNSSVSATDKSGPSIGCVFLLISIDAGRDLVDFAGQRHIEDNSKNLAKADELPQHSNDLTEYTVEELSLRQLDLDQITRTQIEKVKILSAEAILSSKTLNSEPEELKAAKERISELTREVQELQQEKENDRKSFDEKYKILEANFEQVVEEKEKALQNIDDSIKYGETLESRYKDHLEDFKKQLNHNTEKQSSLSNQIRILEDEIQRLKRDREHLELTVQNSHSEISELRSQIVTADGQLTSIEVNTVSTMCQKCLQLAKGLLRHTNYCIFPVIYDLIMESSDFGRSEIEKRITRVIDSSCGTGASEDQNQDSLKQRMRRFALSVMQANVGKLWTEIHDVMLSSLQEKETVNELENSVIKQQFKLSDQQSLEPDWDMLSENSSTEKAYVIVSENSKDSSETSFDEPSKESGSKYTTKSLFVHSLANTREKAKGLIEQSYPDLSEQQIKIAELDQMLTKFTEIGVYLALSNPPMRIGKSTHKEDVNTRDYSRPNLTQRFALTEELPVLPGVFVSGNEGETCREVYHVALPGEINDQNV